MRTFEEILAIAGRNVGDNETAKRYFDEASRKQDRNLALKSLASSLGTGHIEYLRSIRRPFQPFNPYTPLDGCWIVIVRVPTDENLKRRNAYIDWDVWMVENNDAALEALKADYVRQYMLDAPPKMTIARPLA